MKYPNHQAPTTGVPELELAMTVSCERVQRFQAQLRECASAITDLNKLLDAEGHTQRSLQFAIASLREENLESTDDACVRLLKNAIKPDDTPLN